MYWFTKLCSSSKCWHISLYNIQKKKKSHIHYYHPTLREVFSVGSCQTQSGRYKFSKIQIFCLKVKCYHWQQVLSADRQLCTFSRKCLPNRRACKAIVWSVSHSLEWKWCSMKRVASAARNSWQPHAIFPGPSWCISYFVTRSTQTMCTQKLRFLKVNNFYFSWRLFISETGF